MSNIYGSVDVCCCPKHSTCIISFNPHESPTVWLFCDPHFTGELLEKERLNHLPKMRKPESRGNRIAGQNPGPELGHCSFYKVILLQYPSSGNRVLASFQFPNLSPFQNCLKTPCLPKVDLLHDISLLGKKFLPWVSRIHSGPHWAWGQLPSCLNLQIPYAPGFHTIISPTVRCPQVMCSAFLHKLHPKPSIWIRIELENAPIQGELSVYCSKRYLTFF